MRKRHYFTTMLAALAILIVAPTASAQTSYAPTDDAWAVTAGGGEGVNNQDPTVNYGVQDENRLWIRAASSLGRGTWLKFDLTGVEGPVTEALLNVVVDAAVGNANGIHTVYLYEQADDAWTETELTGNNAPEWGDELGSASTLIRRQADDPDTTFTFDVTDYVNTQLAAGDALISFTLGNPTGNSEEFDGTDLRIFSKEAFLQGDGPSLVVTGGSNTSAEAAELPAGFVVDQNYPNPFNPETSIRFEAPASGHLNVAIYNVLGQEVTQLFDGPVTAGAGQLSWNGRDAAGQLVSTGLYLARFTFDQQVQTVTMTLLR